MVTASCLCGDIRIEISAPLGAVTACHCTQCRKITGHHSAAVPVAWQALTVTGDITWFESSEAARRGFCGICGSNLFWDGPGTHLSIFAGTLDGDPGVRLAGHIFCADKGAYYEIEGDLPKAPGNDAVLTTQVME